SELAVAMQEIAAQSFVPESFVMLIRSAATVPFECLAATSLTSSVPPQEHAQRIAVALDGYPSPSLIVVDPLHTAPNNALHEGLRTAGIEVAMILGRRENLLGAIFLGPRRSGDAYFAKDLTFLDSLTELASIALDNSLLYQ